MTTNRDLDESYILSGRGPFAYGWAGNVLARRIVDIFLPMYYKSTNNSMKGVVISFVISFLTNKGMKFVEKDPEDKTKWILLPDVRIRDKCAHMFRDAVKKQNEMMKKKHKQDQQQKKNKVLACTPVSAPSIGSKNLPAPPSSMSPTTTLLSPYLFEFAKPSSTTSVLSDAPSYHTDVENVEDFDSLNLEDLDEISSIISSSSGNIGNHDDLNGFA